MRNPQAQALSEMEGYWPTLRSLAISGRIVGPQIHDARIAALCQHHGIDELWTADRDFSRFGDLVTRNPLLSESD